MTTTAPAKAPLGTLILKRTVIGLVLMLLLLVPFIVLMAITKQPSASYAAMGAIVGLVAVAAGGLRVGIVTSIILSVLAPISIVAGLTPITGAALMAIMTITVGRMSRFGLHRAVMLVPVFLAWTIMAPVPWIDSKDLSRISDLLARFGYSLPKVLDHLHPTQHTPNPEIQRVMSHAMISMKLDQTYLAWLAVFFFVGAAVAVAAAPLLLKKLPKPSPTLHTRAESMPYTITITLLTTIGTWYFLEHPKQTGGPFFIAAILVLAQVGTDIQWRLALERVLGTAGGILLLMVVMAVMGGSSFTEVFGVPFPMNIYAVGLVFGMLAIISKLSPRAWIYYVFIAPAAALLNAFTTTEAAHLGTARIVDNLVGAALVLLAALITLGASKLEDKRAGTVTTAVEVTAPSV